jgi:DNA-binding transcriptional ArsR family regulator
MLLAAYVAQHESVELSPTALCAYSGEPAATACHWLRKMQEEGLVRPRRGQRDSPIVVITRRAALGLEQLLEHLISESSDFARPA